MIRMFVLNSEIFGSEQLLVEMFFFSRIREGMVFRCGRTGCGIGVVRHSACLVVGTVPVGGFDSLFRFKEPKARVGRLQSSFISSIALVDRKLVSF